VTSAGAQPVARSRVVSVSTAAFDGYDLDLATAEIAALGATHVELAYIQGYVEFDESAFGEANAARVARALAAAGLASVALSAHVNAGGERAAEELERRMDFARRIGAAIVITNAAPQAQRAAFLRNLERLLPRAEALGAVLALENPGHGSGNLIGTAADAVALVEAIGSPQLRVNYDFGNVLTYSGETVRPETDFEAALPVAAHFHFKDLRSDAAGWSFTAVGDGTVDYAAVLRRLDALGDATPVGLELPLRLRRPGRQDPARAPDPVPLPVIREAVRRSLDFVRRTGGEPSRAG